MGDFFFGGFAGIHDGAAVGDSDFCFVDGEGEVICHFLFLIIIILLARYNQSEKNDNPRKKTKENMHNWE